VIYAGFFLLLAFALMFSRHEKQLWGSGKTPFGFVVYPFLVLLFIAVFISPGMGFQRLHPETIFVIALFFSLFATASIALARIAGERAPAAPRLESVGEQVRSGVRYRTVWSIEYVVLAGILVLAFGANMASRGAGVVEKGGLGVGGIESHLIEIGMAYLVIAASQHRGQRLLRLVFAIIVVWILAINQVKYLILLPLAAAVLYRWVSGQLAAWKVALLAAAVPLVLGIGVYAYFGASAAAAGVPLTGALIRELTWHMMGYLVAGILGLDQLLVQVRTVAFGASGLEYALAPFVNLARFVAGAGDYFDVVNPLYLIIHSSELIDSNVFTLFGSLLYRGGWIGAISITLAYAMICYWVWSRWRVREGALACAAGSWWMAPLLFAWHDAFFIHLSVIEIMVVLSLRGNVRLPGFVRRARGSASETLPGPAT
jgi:hypothetical protein